MTETDMNALADEIISDAMIAYEEHPVPPLGAADGSWQAMKDVLKVGITAALRSTLASVDVTGMSEAQIEDIRSHIRGSTEEKATYDYELGSGWRCFHCGEMFRTPGGAALHFGKPTDKPACTPASGQPSGEPLADCDWPAGEFTFHDDPGEHDPCYVVMPGGASLAVNHHAKPGVDIARAKFIVAACNAALRNDDDETYEIGKRDGYEDAIQDLDLATGGDGEFKGSTIPGAAVDVPTMGTGRIRPLAGAK